MFPGCARRPKEFPVDVARPSRGRRGAGRRDPADEASGAYQLISPVASTMAPMSVQNFFKDSRSAVANADLRRKLDNANTRQREHAAHAIAEFPAYYHEKDAARAVKEDAVGRLDQLLLELRRK